MGHPRWELAGREMGRGIYRRRWDIQGRNCQVGRWEEELTTGDGTSKMRRWDIQDGNWHAELGELAAREKGERNLPQAGREMRRGIYHMTWDFQGRNGTSKAGSGR